MMHLHDRTNLHPFLLLVSWLGLVALAGCGSDTVPVYDVECEDDEIGWSLDFPNLVKLPLPEFAVECASGWGHGVETRAASEVVEMPIHCQWYLPHPQGGLLLFIGCEEERWSERLGVEVKSRSVAWVDEKAEKVRWLRDDLGYDRPVLAPVEGGTELWVWGEGGGPYDYVDYLSRFDLSSGELLERVVVPDIPLLVEAAWPPDGGLWQVTVELHDDYDYDLYKLQRMSSFGKLGPVIRTYEGPHRPLEGYDYAPTYPAIHPTPGGGVLFRTGDLQTSHQLESLAEDGSVGWVLEKGNTVVAVDQHGGFLNVFDGRELDHKENETGLAIQRRKLDDASVLWTRVHHRYHFADEPKPGEWLDDSGWSYAARAESGYLIGGGHAYPASSCPQQPIVWAIDINGEVEWAHRVEVCGTFDIPSDRVEGRALVVGFSYPNGDRLDRDRAEWLQYFDL